MKLTSFFIRNSLISESLKIYILLLILAMEDSRGGKGDGDFPFLLSDCSFCRKWPANVFHIKLLHHSGFGQKHCVGMKQAKMKKWESCALPQGLPQEALKRKEEKRTTAVSPSSGFGSSSCRQNMNATAEWQDCGGIKEEGYFNTWRLFIFVAKWCCTNFFVLCQNPLLIKDHLLKISSSPPIQPSSSTPRCTSSYK